MGTQNSQENQNVFIFLPYTTSFLVCHMFFGDGTLLSMFSFNLNVELIVPQPRSGSRGDRGCATYIYKWIVRLVGLLVILFICLLLWPQ